MRNGLQVIAALIGLCAAFGACGFGNKPGLTLAKGEFYPGDEISVAFKAPKSYDKTAWVGLIPSTVAHGSEDVNDQHDVAYQYLEQRTEGTLVFSAPARPGAYDFRMNDRDGGGKEICFVSFIVRDPITSPGDVALTLEKSAFGPGEEIAVSFRAPAGLSPKAWVGLIPSAVEHGSEATNDQHDVAYQYLDRRMEGKLVFNAPGEPGAYDFRLNDSDEDGREVASVSFTVSAGAEPPPAPVTK